MAISSYKTFLMTNTTGLTGGEWTKLLDVCTSPAIGGTPEKLDTTTLSDAGSTSINGIQQLEDMKWEANYTKEEYDKLKLLEGKQQAYAVWMGGTGSGSELVPDGSNGKYKFMGELSVMINEVGVNAVQKMTLTIAPSTVPEVDKGE